MNTGWVAGFPNHWASGDFEFEEPGHPFWFLLSGEGAHGLAEVRFGSRSSGVKYFLIQSCELLVRALLKL